MFIERVMCLVDSDRKTLCKNLYVLLVNVDINETEMSSCFCVNLMPVIVFFQIIDDSYYHMM